MAALAKPPIILVVDDEQLVRDLEARVLATHGFKVLVAAGGEQALGIVQQHKVHIDLVLSDIVMPGMTGPQLVRRVKELSPDTKAVLMTGYTPPGTIDPDVPVLTKPFSSDILLKKVDEMLRHCRGVHGDISQLRSRSKQLMKKSRKLSGELEKAGSRAQEAVRRSKELRNKPKRAPAPGSPDADAHSET